MSSTDERIVKMQFDNASFMAKAKETRGALNDVNTAVNQTGNTKGLLSLSGAMQKVQVTASKMSVVTAAAIGTITAKATAAGVNLVKSLTLDPIKQGFNEYQQLLTKQNVIQNATGKSAVVVKGYLNQLNTYSDKTIYSFGDMTDSITQFVNAGVPLGKSVKAIQGIANAAAFAGATTEEAKRAMLGFSQATSTGFLGLQDYKQIENANLGTVRFKNELIKAAVAQGTLTKAGDEYVTKSGKHLTATRGFRDALKDQFVTTNVLNATLRKYADTTTELGRKAFAAATKVRTFSAFMSTTKEAIGSVAARSFGILIGGLNQSTKLWTNLSLAVGTAIGNVGTFFATTLHTFRRLGGQNKVFQALGNIAAPIVAIFKALGTAFRAAFPGDGGRNNGTGKVLYGMAAALELITRPLQFLAKAITASTPLLTIFFAVIAAGINGIKSVIGIVVRFAESLTAVGDIKPPKAGGFLDFILKIGSSIGNTVKALAGFISQGQSIGEAFKSLKFTMPKLPKIPSLGGFGDMLNQMGAAGLSKITDFVNKIKDLIGSLKGLAPATKPVSDLGKKAKSTGDHFGFLKGILDGIVAIAKFIGPVIGAVFTKIGDLLKNFFKNMDGNDLVSSFNMAIFATFGVQIIRITNAIANGFETLGDLKALKKGFLDGIKDGVSAFQNAARAKLLLSIAIAIGILALALIALSFVPADKLAVGLTALAGVIALTTFLLKGLGTAVEAMSGKGTVPKMAALGAAIIAIALAILLLALAMRVMNKVDFKSFAKGMITLGVVMQLIKELGKKMEASGKQILAAGISISLIAGSLILLAGALILFKFVKPESMVKAGLAITALVIAMKVLGTIDTGKLVAMSLLFISLGYALVAITLALLGMAKVKWESIGKLAVVLAALTLSISLMQASGGLAAALILFALGKALVYTAGALLILNQVDWSSIGKLAVVLTILVVALAAVAAVLYLLAPVAPVLLLLALAFVALGVAVALLAAGLATFVALGGAAGAAFIAFATAAAIGIAVFLQTIAQEAPIISQSILQILQSMVDTIVGAVPIVIQGIKDLFTAVKKQFTDPGPADASGKAGQSLIDKLKSAIQAKMPEIIQKGKDLLLNLLKGLASVAGQLGAAGAKVIANFIGGVSKHVGEIISAGTSLIINFINGLSKNAVQIANAAGQAIVDFLNGLTAAVDTYAPQIRAAAGRLGWAIIDGITGGIGDKAQQAYDKIQGVMNKVVSIAKKIPIINSPSRVFRDIGRYLMEGLSGGIQAYAAQAITSMAASMTGVIATAMGYVDQATQAMTQSAIAAQAKADGLAKSAQLAAAAAAKTKKNKKDDKAAKQLQAQADAAAAAAEAASNAASAQKDAAERQGEFLKAGSLDRAKMRSEDAQAQIDAATAAEQASASSLAQANAVAAQAAKTANKKLKKQLLDQAAQLRQAADDQAKAADAALSLAGDYAADALAYQKKAGEEAAASYQQVYDQAKQDDADQKAYNALSDADKAKARRQQAADLQAKADADLAKAKDLALTDLDAANDLAATALSEADQARQYLDDAESLEKGGGSAGGSANGTVVNVDPTEAAAIAFNNFQDTYDAAVAAAATTQTVEFHQTNNSPEALSPTEVYRQTNNLFTQAVDQLADAAA